MNASFVDNQTVVNQMYYFEQFDVVLENVPVNLEGAWEPQWEKNYSFAVPIEGQYKLWFFLFLDQVPWYAQNLTHMYDYAGTPSDDLVEQAVNNQLLSLNLNLNVRAA